MYRSTTPYPNSKIKYTWKTFSFLFFSEFVTKHDPNQFKTKALNLSSVYLGRVYARSLVSLSNRVCLTAGRCFRPVLWHVWVMHTISFIKIREIITCNMQVILHKGLWVCTQIEYYLWSFWRLLLSHAESNLRGELPSSLFFPPYF